MAADAVQPSRAIATAKRFICAPDGKCDGEIARDSLRRSVGLVVGSAQRPMFNRRQVVLGALLLVATARLAPPARTALPDRLTDEQFWTLVTESSEPGGTFRSDNLLSNEL